MAKNTRDPSCKCKCSKCGLELQSTPDTPHRNCGGGEGAPPRERDKRLDGASRGTWKR